jgi:hypothetical protein
MSKLLYIELIDRDAGDIKRPPGVAFAILDEQTGRESKMQALPFVAAPADWPAEQTASMQADEIFGDGARVLIWSVCGGLYYSVDRKQEAA